MLRLASASRPDWVKAAVANMDVVLLDHAHCEKKAASTAINLIFRYQYHPELMVPFSAIAREELRHFEQVLGIMGRRGLSFGRQHPSSYAVRLHQVVRRAEPERFVDTMICCAFIEARSCERMQLLAESLEDKDLSELYAGLLQSEARHHQTFLDLATTACSAEAVYTRVEEIALYEAEVIAVADPEIRLHS
jgi:tRNA-(ms[2]io[6]A)-hydroxylase